MKTLLIGHGYWGKIVEKKIRQFTDDLFIADSKINIDHLLSEMNFDVVFVCSSTNSHYNLVKKLINYKINIFCEKPFTGNLEQAKELYQLSEKSGSKIYIDNIFLKRSEINYINNQDLSNVENVKYIWNKKEDTYKEDLLDSLLYHDLYLLLTFFKNEFWKVRSFEMSNSKLSLNLHSNSKNAEFIYNREFEKKEKKIFLDLKCIDLSSPINDPLLEIISEIFEKKIIDYQSNKTITLKTLNLLKKVKEYDNS